LPSRISFGLRRFTAALTLAELKTLPDSANLPKTLDKRYRIRYYIHVDIRAKSLSANNSLKITFLTTQRE